MAQSTHPFGPTLSVTNFNIVCSLLGGFITLFGLVSYLFKEKLFMSEALISLVFGVIFSPHATDLVRPIEYAGGSQENLDSITLYFSRLVLGVQLVLAGVQLPSRYLKIEWKSLALLLGPIMTASWIISSLIIWGMVPDLPYLHALAIAACVTPTDPVLSNSIVKGKFADKNVPKELQKVIIAESGANDGLGYPFLFFALYLIKYLGEGQDGNGGTAIGLWFVETWVYTIILSVIYGATVGWIAKELLHWAEERRFVDRESFLVFAIALALFIVGTCGMIGSDDVLACFIAGNAFTWDDWFRLETMDDSLQPTIDMLLNLSIFLWYGAVAPWDSFGSNPHIPTYRLVFLAVLILLFKRLPVVYALHNSISQIEEKRQALFVGFFGPIGVSAIFYVYISLEFLNTITVDGVVREDAEQLREVLFIVVWFLAICSIIVHGMSIPLGKLGFYLPRTISQAIESNSNESPAPFRVGGRVSAVMDTLRERRPRTPGASGTSTPRYSTQAAGSTAERPVFRIGGSVIRDRSPQRTEGHVGSPGNSIVEGQDLNEPGRDNQRTDAILANRTIRFPDEQQGVCD